MKTTLIFATAVASFCLAPANAQAPDAYVVSEAVSHGDLDLSRPRGLRIFDQRIRLAARALCGAASDIDVAGKNDARRCRSDIYRRVAGERRAMILAARSAGGTALSSR